MTTIDVMLDRLLKLSSLSGAVLIFCGVLKLIIYYSAFNISIVEFLSFSEIITSFLDDINLLLIFGLAMIIQTTPLLNYIHKKSKLSIDEFYNKMLTLIYHKKYWYILFFVILASSIGIMLSTNTISLNYLVIYILIFCLIQTLTYLVMSLDQEGKIEISNSNMVISLIIIISSAIFLLAQHDIQLVKSGGDNVTINTNDGDVFCNPNSKNIYLGKTDNFIFVRSNLNSTISIPVSEVKKMEFN